MYDTPKITKKDSSTANSTSTNSSSKNGTGHKNNRNFNKKEAMSNGSNVFSENNRKREEIKTLYKNFISKLKPYYSFQDMSNLKK